LSVCLLSLLVACSQNSAGKSLDSTSITGGEPSTSPTTPSSDGQINAPSEETPAGNETRNNVQPADILKSISGTWSSTCRDSDAKHTNTSEKDVIMITLDPKGNSISLYTLYYSGSRSCEKRHFKSLDEHTFALGEARDGHTERNSALALDLIDQKINLEKPQNVLLVFANPRDSSKKGRILFEIFDNQRTGIRLQIDEWRSFLPERLKDQDAVILQLESIVNAGEVKDRNTRYTKSQAFSRSLADDLELIQDWLED
jgi:hypothetical protein